MDWLKELLEKATITDGKLDVVALMELVKVEFPKHAVPKKDYNDKVTELKTANDNIADLKTAAENIKKEYALKENSLQPAYWMPIISSINGVVWINLHLTRTAPL